MSALATRIRAATAGAFLVGRRRARADIGLLSFAAVVLAVSVALSLAVPRLFSHAADAAVRDAVTDAGPSVDLTTRVGAPAASTTQTRVGRDPNYASEVRDSAASVGEALTPALRAVSGDPTVTISTNAGGATAGGAPIQTRLVYVGAPDTERQDDLVTWVDGTAPALSVLPEDDPDVPGLPTRQLQVGMQADAAAALGVQVGDQVLGAAPTRGPVDIVVTGLYTVTDPDDDAWTGLDDLLALQDPRAGTAQRGRAALLVTDDSLPDLQLDVPGALPRHVLPLPDVRRRPGRADGTAGPGGRRPRPGGPHHPEAERRPEPDALHDPGLGARRRRHPARSCPCAAVRGRRRAGRGRCARPRAGRAPARRSTRGVPPRGAGAGRLARRGGEPLARRVRARRPPGRPRRSRTGGRRRSRSHGGLGCGRRARARRRALARGDRRRSRADCLVRVPAAGEPGRPRPAGPSPQGPPARRRGSARRAGRRCVRLGPRARPAPAGRR